MRRTLALLAGSALLTGCGGSSHDIADGPSSAAPAATSSPASSTTSPTTTAPTHETAKQFIRRWVKTNTEAQRTGDLTAFDAMNEPTCESCQALDKAVRRIYNAGGVVEPSDIEVLWIKQHSDHTYYMREHVPGSRYREAASGPWKHFAGGTDTEIYTLTKVNGAWRMAESAGLAGSAE
jgi:hypothetical protein